MPGMHNDMSLQVHVSSLGRVEGILGCLERTRDITLPGFIAAA